MPFPTLVLAWALLALFSIAETRAQDSLSLPAVVKRTMEFHFREGRAHSKSLDEFVRRLPVPQYLRLRAGVFVTLSRDGKARACWGSVLPEHPDLVKSTAYATVAALTREYRYPPIKRSEWRALKPQVTVVRSLEPIDGLSGQNPLRDGLMVRSGGKAGVLLPGEARDAHYQLIACKLKAGIGAGERCQLYRIKADIYD
ncbi:MAG TPA: AMMECR1 domain-containing protein [Candidatus Obscuribacterales bacterium]